MERLSFSGLLTLPRRYRRGPRLFAGGYLPNWPIDPRTLVHKGLNFVLLLNSATGRFRCEVDGRACAVALPALHVNIPGRAYRANPEDGPIEELYFAYEAQEIPAIEAMGFELEPPLREISLTARLSGMIRDIYELGENIYDFGNPDRMDALAESIVMEAMLSPAGKELAENERKTRKIASYIERHFLENPDIGALLAGQGMSERTFLRTWKQIRDLPPTRYLQYLKIKEAKRLLDDTGDRIGQISAALGFGDMYYFSRVFREHVGMSPRAYRQRMDETKT